MNQGSLPVDDLPPSQPLPQRDSLLHHQLEKALCRHFFETCDGTTQAQLMTCQWTLSLQSGELSLIIRCPDEGRKQQISSNLKALAQGLQAFSNTAKISIFSSQNSKLALEIPIIDLL